jgi:hypothetical protein
VGLLLAQPAFEELNLTVLGLCYGHGAGGVGWVAAARVLRGSEAQGDEVAATELAVGLLSC